MIDFKTVFSVSQFARSLNDHLRTEFGAVRIEGEVAFDNKIVATDLGYFISAAVA